MRDYWRTQPRVPAGNPEGGQWTQSGVISYLKNISHMTDGKGLEALVLTYGRHWTPAKHDYPMERAKECFKNAFLLCETYPELTYVEGFAISEIVGIPFHHAWAVDKKSKVIDVTWEDGVEYFGVPFNQDYIRDLMLTKGTYGVFDFMSNEFRKMVRYNKIEEGIIPYKWRRK